MSGGHWDYGDSDLKNQIFGYADNHKSNPLGDAELSELLWDVFNLLHDFDWYISGDTGKEDWEESRAAFKKKWLRGESTKRLEAIIDQRIEDLRTELKDIVKEQS